MGSIELILYTCTQPTITIGHTYICSGISPCDVYDWLSSHSISYRCSKCNIQMTKRSWSNKGKTKWEILLYAKHTQIHCNCTSPPTIAEWHTVIWWTIMYTLTLFHMGCIFIFICFKMNWSFFITRRVYSYTICCINTNSMKQFIILNWMH